MGKEIERKFLVTGNGWQDTLATNYRQGYLSTDKNQSVRVRLAGEQDYLTIKGASVGASRTEHRYPNPVEDSLENLAHLCLRSLIEMCPHIVKYCGLTRDLEEFSGGNAG